MCALAGRGLRGLRTGLRDRTTSRNKWEEMGYREEEGMLNGSTEVGPGLSCTGGDGGPVSDPSLLLGVRRTLV